jgi:hypothetical protein
MNLLHNAIVAGMAALLCAGAAQAQQSATTKGTGTPIMSEAEQKAHDAKMHSFKTYAECKAYFTEHLRMIEARAKAQGRSQRNLKPNECEDMRDQGLLK